MVRKMAMSCRILNMKDDQAAKASDLAYWRSQPAEARLAALEEIRREYHQWAYGFEPRFQRVYRVLKR